jgi:hypothetical protein
VKVLSPGIGETVKVLSSGNGETVVLRDTEGVGTGVVVTVGAKKPDPHANHGNMVSAMTSAKSAGTETGNNMAMAIAELHDSQRKAEN